MPSPLSLLLSIIEGFIAARTGGMNMHVSEYTYALVPGVAIATINQMTHGLNSNGIIEISQVKIVDGGFEKVERGGFWHGNSPLINGGYGLGQIMMPPSLRDAENVVRF